MFCFKCGEIVENENCRRCNDNNLAGFNPPDFSPVCLGFLPIDGAQRNMIMAMGQVFDDQRRR